jgi:hypothetical protein
MIRAEGYAIREDLENLTFEFDSHGPKGTITKIVQFTPLPQNELLYNLGFGDKIEGTFDDSTVSDNNDMRLVLQTIANLVHDFLDKYPNRTILVIPVDRRRKLLYNRVFQQRFEEITSSFFVEGYVE